MDAENPRMPHPYTRNVLQAGQTVFPRKDHTDCLSHPYQMVIPENIHQSKIIQSEDYIHEYAYMFMHAITINGKRSHEFEINEGYMEGSRGRKGKEEM